MNSSRYGEVFGDGKLKNKAVNQTSDDSGPSTTPPAAISENTCYRPGNAKPNVQVCGNQLIRDFTVGHSPDEGKYSRNILQ